jgi:hypothetical protein
VRGLAAGIARLPIRLQPQHGYKLMKSIGFSSAKTYQILARLQAAGWLDRLDDPDASPESRGPPRITYRLAGNAVPKARRLLAEASSFCARLWQPRFSVATFVFSVAAFVV